MLDLLETQVLVPGTIAGFGIIKYIGPIRGKVGTFAGLELDASIAATRGRNNGEVEGVRYFEVSLPGSGLFIPWDRLRFANSHLPANIRNLSRTASAGRDHISTPSPTTRGLKTRQVSSIGSDDRPLNAKENTTIPLPKLYVPKTRVSSKDQYKPVNDGSESKSPSLGNNVNSHGSRSDYEMERINRELADARSLIDVKDRALLEKTAILEDLQTTINQLNPILQDYENVISEKDKKLQRQKIDYECAREEWRQSLDLMLNAQQETEQLYELEILDLKAELASTAHKSKSSDGPSSAAFISDLQARIQLLTRENELLISQVTEADKTPGKNTSVEVYLRQIESLEKELRQAKLELASTRGALDVAGKELESNLLIIAKLKEENYIAAKAAADNLADRLNTLSVDEWQSKELHLQSQVSSLEDKLNAKQKSLHEVEQHLTELKRLNENNSTQLDQANADLIKQLTEKESSQRHRIEELEKKLQLSGKEKVPPLVESTGNQDLEEAQNLIAELRHQLEMRPSFDELTELQNSMDEIDTLHQKELMLLKNRIAALLAEKNDLAKAVHEHRAFDQLETENGAISSAIMESQSIKKSESTMAIAAPSSGTSELLNGEHNALILEPLQVYTPASATDPSAGRMNWCGLCERDGHSSLECPYENDMF